MEPLEVDEMYGEWAVSEEVVEAALNRSLEPRPSTSLFDAIDSLALVPAARVLDIGARDARYSVILAERFGFDVVAVEPVDRHLGEAGPLIAASPARDRIDLRRGTIEEIPAPDAAFDLIFCRDVLSHIENLGTALDECFRVLKTRGRMLIYQTFATAFMEPAEAARIYPDLAVVPSSMAPAHLETESRRAGFSIDGIDVVGSEWREAWEEDGTMRTSRALLHAARLLRAGDELRAELGDTPYRVELSNALWGVYQMIGKLEPRIYLLSKPTAG